MGHAYYEFQHVELANVGSGKKRQPYAGLSDLLASDPSQVLTEPQPQSRVKNPPGGPTSNIFGADEVTPPRPVRPNKMASNIAFGDAVDSPPSSATSSPPPTPVKPASPNPVTGQGYEPAEPIKKPSPQPATPRRRIPPGGYSSPLW